MNMGTQDIPMIIVTLTCLIFPAIVIGTWFVYIERQQIS